MLIIDGHQDIAYNTLTLGRDFTESVFITRQREGAPRPGIGTRALALPELLTAGVGIVFGTLFTLPAHAIKHTSLPAKCSYRTPDEAHQQAYAQLQVYHTLAQRNDVCLVRTWPDAQQMQHHVGTQVGIVVLMENADPIRTPNEVAWWQQQGVRIIGPAWKATRYCGGTGQPGPLTAEGRALLAEMARSGIILDVSHMAEESFWQALEQFDGVVIASHSNCRAYAPPPLADRHLSDAMIRAVIDRDGVIGVVLFNRFLRPDVQDGQPKATVTLQAVVRHIDHICQIAGNARHVAIGSDSDGGFGSESMPHELDSVADLPHLAALLQQIGWSADEVTAVMGQNWLRILERGLPA